jgi:hypothetical protein
MSTFSSDYPIINRQKRIVYIKILLAYKLALLEEACMEISGG